jgi:large subunit ribosomal protein L15
MPIHRRLPKRGFTNIFKKKVAIVNLRDLKDFESGTRVDAAVLMQAGLVKGAFDTIKLLGKGEISVPLTIRLDMVSKGAGEKITAAGGKIEDI